MPYRKARIAYILSNNGNVGGGDDGESEMSPGRVRTILIPHVDTASTCVPLYGNIEFRELPDSSYRLLSLIPSRDVFMSGLMGGGDMAIAPLGLIIICLHGFP